MATEKQLKSRIIGTSNIAKITKSMKMVSASKLRGDQSRLNNARPFAAWANVVTGAPRDLEGLDPKDFADNNLIVLFTTDKGLCGGVNSIMARQTRQMLAKLESSGKKYKLLVQGEKGRSLFRRTHSDSVIAQFTERQAPYTWSLASAVAQEVVGGEYGGVHIIYNKFKSAIAYVPSIKSITPMLDANIEFFKSKYDMEPDAEPEALTNFYEYTLATQLFHSLMENACSEQSARMTAMENASKNAKEMIGKLTLKYNRARQTRITTELIEIISGAAALETKK
jgi:F-type H+-transporting ATPase subunit gamma